MQFVKIKTNGNIITSTCQYKDKNKFVNKFMIDKTEEYKFTKYLKKSSICLFAKKYDCSLTEKKINKYDFFPPPIDNKLFYGTILLVKFSDNDIIIDFSEKDFLNYINKLHKGFDDINSDSSFSEDESNYSDLDDFIVSDGSIEESDYSDDENEFV